MAAGIERSQRRLDVVRVRCDDAEEVRTHLGQHPFERAVRPRAHLPRQRFGPRRIDVADGDELSAAAGTVRQGVLADLSLAALIGSTIVAAGLHLGEGGWGQPRATLRRVGALLALGLVLCAALLMVLIGLPFSRPARAVATSSIGETA